MINTPPRERSEPQPGATTTTNNASNNKAYAPDRSAYYRDDYSNPSSPRPYEDYAGGMIPAASALASLHHYKSGGGGGSDWDAEGVSYLLSIVCFANLNKRLTILPLKESVSDSERERRPRSSVELPPIQIHNSDITSEPFPGLNSARHRDLLPSIMATSPPGRSSTLPPLQRTFGPHRPGKQSVTKRSKESQHRKQKSRDIKEWAKRGKVDIAGDLLRPILGQERPRPYSAEPTACSPWDDLLDAATSVAEEDLNEDRASVSLHRGRASSLTPVLS